jgi:hypothetical protein
MTELVKEHHEAENEEKRDDIGDNPSPQRM